VIRVQCLDEDAVLDFIDGRSSQDQLAAVESHVQRCQSCRALISAALAARANRPMGIVAPAGSSAVERPELSCRFLVPLLNLAGERLPAPDVMTFLASWRTTLEELRDEGGWVSLRFCEALTEWLATRVGVDAVIAQTLRESYSPKTLGLLYPFVRAFGSPRAGYGHLPSFVRLVNRVSDVQVLSSGRNRATIAYRPKAEDGRERSPLICEVRRAQIAAGPRLWNLPDAVVEEAECQTRGGDRCVYRLAWVEPSKWWRSVLGGALAAALAWLATSGSWPVTALAVISAVGGVHLWSARRELRELRALEETKMSMLARVTRLRPVTDPAPAATPPALGTASDAVVPDPVSLPQPGQLLAGRYRLGGLLGAGGMGFVFAAVDEADGQPLAVKVLRPELSSPRWAARMAREVQLARTIRHPNVCRVMSFGQVDGYSFITMDLATGGNLSRELRSKAPGREWVDRIADVTAIVSALAAVHEAGIVHRDLTPQNILRFADGRLAIADFSLALDQPGMTTQIRGTPSYMAPEVLAGETPSYASDVWQLGMLMHEVLFGRRPDATAPLASTDPSEQRLLTLCADCLHVDPLQRPANAGSVARALDAIELVPLKSR
jgi:serine/threonine-protein kinase